MALTNKIGAVEAAQSLTTWLSARMPETTDLRVSDVRVPSSNGLSTETVLFTASWQGGSQAMVARVQPDGEGVFPSYDLAKEAAVMSALADHTPVPAPRVLFFEDDPAVLGAPFLVMEHVDGRIPSDDPPFTAAGWVLDLEPEQRRTMWENSLTVLADIHAADHRDLGLPEGGLPEQLATWEDFLRWAGKGEPNPTIEAALAWLRDNQPTDDGDKVLNWGDARVGNLIFGDDLTVGAVLDWEMVTLASREQDLGWWLFLMRHHTEGIGLPLPEGIPDAAETVAFYEKVAGTQARNLEYYEIFAGTRLAIIMVRAAHMLIAVGALPPDNPMALNNPASQLVAKLLGLPAPSGDTTSFIGNR